MGCCSGKEKGAPRCRSYSRSYTRTARCRFPVSKRDSNTSGGVLALSFALVVASLIVAVVEPLWALVLMRELSTLSNSDAAAAAADNAALLGPAAAATYTHIRMKTKHLPLSRRRVMSICFQTQVGGMNTRWV
jgi:hypothetical protein